MKHIFIFVLFSSMLSAMQLADEEEAVSLALISLEYNKRSSRNDELYRDLLYNAARNQYHALADLTLRHIKRHLGDKDLVPIINKGFFAAASVGNVQFLKRILEENPSIKNKSRALHMGAKNGNLEVVRLLLENGANVNHTAKHGQTVLAVAMKYDREPVVKFLLDNGVDPNGPAPHHYNDLLSWTATLEKDEKYLKLLLDYGADPNGSKDSKALRPIMVAANLNRPIILALLLYYGANPDFQMPESKHTALIQATKHGYIESVEVLTFGTASKRLRDILVESFEHAKWAHNFMVLLPAELRPEIARIHVAQANHLITDKSGKNALMIARQYKDKPDNNDKKKQYDRIIEILESRKPREANEVKTIEQHVSAQS